MNIHNESPHCLTSAEVAALQSFLTDKAAPYEILEVTIYPRGMIEFSDADGPWTRRYHLHDVFPEQP